jgi:ribosomal-protein-alanine N-acetyltransferase
MAVTLPLTVDGMRIGDVEAVHEIERLSFTTPWPSYAFEQELSGNRLARYVVARAADPDGERVVGFAGVWLMVDEAHITTFGVHPDWRRRGVGRRLLLRLAELALELGAARMTLEVRVGNEVAQALYRSFGFAVAGRRPRYYTDDGEDAFVMSTPHLVAPAMQAVLAAERARQAHEETS